MDGSFVANSISESPFEPEAFIVKSESPLAVDEFGAEACKAEVIVASNVLVLRAPSTLVVDGSSIVFALGEVEDKLAVPLEELEG